MYIIKGQTYISARLNFCTFKYIRFTLKIFTFYHVRLQMRCQNSHIHLKNIHMFAKRAHSLSITVAKHRDVWTKQTSSAWISWVGWVALPGYDGRAGSAGQAGSDASWISNRPGGLPELPGLNFQSPRWADYIITDGKTLGLSGVQWGIPVFAKKRRNSILCVVCLAPAPQVQCCKRLVRMSAKCVQKKGGILSRGNGKTQRLSTLSLGARGATFA